MSTFRIFLVFENRFITKLTTVDWKYPPKFPKSPRNSKKGGDTKNSLETKSSYFLMLFQNSKEKSTLSIWKTRDSGGAPPKYPPKWGFGGLKIFSFDSLGSIYPVKVSFFFCNMFDCFLQKKKIVAGWSGTPCMSNRLTQSKFSGWRAKGWREGLTNPFSLCKIDDLGLAP